MAKKKSAASKSEPQSGCAGIATVLGTIIVLILGYYGIDLNGILNETGTTTESTETTSTTTDSADGFSQLYQIYFTNPTCPPEEEQVGGIDQTIIQDLDAAQNEIHIAVFDLELNSIIDALIRAKKRGVEVHIVVDDENTPASSINRLRRNGISVVGDKRSAFMHNKIVVVDQRYLWMGSMNLANKDTYCYNNNFIRFDSAELAANYVTEVEEMYTDRQFGPTSPINTVNTLTLDGVRIENYFASEEKVAPIIAELVSAAKSEIFFMAFSFTQEDIGEAMIKRGNNGVEVRGVFEGLGANGTSSYYKDFSRLKNPKISVRIDGNPYLMHHKVIIIDRSITLFGSFNFSENANNSNDENILIVYDPQFAAYFTQEFETVWQEAKK